MPRAQSNYKQVRITLTEQAMRLGSDERMVIFRILVKPVDEDWRVAHVVYHDAITHTRPLHALSEVYDLLGELLGAAAFPRIDA